MAAAQDLVVCEVSAPRTSSRSGRTRGRRYEFEQLHCSCRARRKSCHAHKTTRRATTRGPLPAPPHRSPEGESTRADLPARVDSSSPWAALCARYPCGPCLVIPSPHHLAQALHNCKERMRAIVSRIPKPTSQLLVPTPSRPALYSDPESDSADTRPRHIFRSSRAWGRSPGSGVCACAGAHPALSS